MKLSKDQLFSILKNPVMWKSNDILASCPKCQKKEFYISLNDNHPFNCVRKKRCGFQGNIYTLLDELGIRSDYNFKESISTSSELINILDDKRDQELCLDLIEIKMPFGFKRIFYDNYLNQRGFLQIDYNEYHCGITNLDRKLINYIIFGIYQDFKLVAYIGRYKGSKEECDNKKLPRYKNSESDFSKILGGYDDLEKDVTEEVILVEGFFDYKNITSLLNLKENKFVKCCYTFKCHISPEQLYRLQLKGIKKILMLYDPDVIREIKETAINLSKYFEVKVGLIEFKNEDGNLKDPGDLNEEELIHVLENTYSSFEFNLKKVQIFNL